MSHLKVSTLEALASDVEVSPNVNNKPAPGIVHLGLGQFSKAHLACYTDTAINAAGGNWGIVGVSLRSKKTAGQLESQDWLYSVLAESDQKAEVKVIGCLHKVVARDVAQDGVKNAAEIRSWLSNPDIKIVSLTVTEKGYYQGADGNLDSEDPDIAHDLEHPESPMTAIGWIALGLKVRIENGGPLFTPLSLDNLVGNGDVLRTMVLQYVSHVWPSLKDKIENEVPFPSSMVDRIVPATDVDSLERLSQKLGVEDKAGVITEHFSQWVLEDKFVAGRPDWNLAGAVFCEDIEPFESMKLKMLNGTHSALAYLGELLALEAVSDCVRDKVLGPFLRQLMTEEILPEVIAPQGFDLNSYADELFERFDNSYLRHKCAQIAMDGSKKIPQRLLPVIESRIAQGKPINCLVTAIAAWIQFVITTDNLADPLAEHLKSLLAKEGAKEGALANEILQNSGVFSEALSNSADFQSLLQQKLDQFNDPGVRETLTDLV